ncbi:Spo0E family sporulation regulatory protein-aspartic acid phosphatase [Paenibacillus sp. LHD-117]|uniref:Spo0E family sporulation regulatory protein-aspartic acid phosphatase n=1 Tax=Paenibacillus sp. LHD-117 TaxID=3071412 RepID=UPI0027E003D0|nr:Spo0E family sporulation regulatory protein-aspartic acid phosphatase [Paenibacillus sp. LHD-117]MDQ6421016.1 Spo0E family sporulation regulatory protein-aspartic acid phosphatase [Paenibacillus sp. LHD-117]
MDKLLLELEKLRGEMVETALLEQDLLHQDVLVLSQSLDEIIVQVQSERLSLYKSRAFSKTS